MKTRLTTVLLTVVSITALASGRIDLPSADSQSIAPHESVDIKIAEYIKSNIQYDTTCTIKSNIQDLSFYFSYFNNGYSDCYGVELNGRYYAGNHIRLANGDNHVTLTTSCYALSDDACLHLESLDNDGTATIKECHAELRAEKY